MQIHVILRSTSPQQQLCGGVLREGAGVVWEKGTGIGCERGQVDVRGRRMDTDARTPDNYGRDRGGSCVITGRKGGEEGNGKEKRGKHEATAE